jgi:hypothetical protein
LSVPEDDFTPHGLLWTPGHHARSWSAPVGGVGATDPRHVGAGFRLLAPRRFAALWIELALPDGALLATREQFQRAGRLWARVHTCRRILLRWQGERAALELLAYSAGPQALGYALHVRGATAAWRLDGAVPPEAVVVVDGQRLRTGERVEVTGDTSRAWFALDGTPPVWAAEDMAREDERFWAGAPRLSGDWPEAWRRGWVSDLETTRLLVQPPGGIYAGPWPSWMAEWPRAVAAEGSLDMARLAVADGATATAALETLWTQAPAPNLPCVFRDGQPNMVAADGRVCGTSPAWCLPVQQVERAFLWSGDRAWLARILPALAAYLEWWARERVVDGYPTYACTWESGEDDNPRLDPHGTGSSAILGRNRPPELPAALASGAQAIARLHNALGDRAGARSRSAIAHFSKRATGMTSSSDTATWTRRPAASWRRTATLTGRRTACASRRSACWPRWRQATRPARRRSRANCQATTRRRGAGGRRGPAPCSRLPMRWASTPSPAGSPPASSRASGATSTRAPRPARSPAGRCRASRASTGRSRSRATTSTTATAGAPRQRHSSYGTLSDCGRPGTAGRRHSC